MSIKMNRSLKARSHVLQFNLGHNFSLDRLFKFFDNPSWNRGQLDARRFGTHDVPLLKNSASLFIDGIKKIWLEWISLKNSLIWKQLSLRYDFVFWTCHHIRSFLWTKCIQISKRLLKTNFYQLFKTIIKYMWVDKRNEFNVLCACLHPLRFRVKTCRQPKQNQMCIY